MEKIITGTKIVKMFGTNKEYTKILNDINIEIDEGEFVAVMGPSGCGKTTMLFALSGTDTIDKGTIKFKERNIFKMKEKELSDLRRKNFGFIFQQPTMLKNLNLLDNIILPALQENHKDKKSITDKAEGLMRKVGIGGLGNRNIAQVSGGQLQRAGICRALMCSPDILFADEPTGALNSKSAKEIMTLMSRINEEGTAILLVTHDTKVATHADRVLFMKDGQIIKELSFHQKELHSIDEKARAISKEMMMLGI